MIHRARLQMANVLGKWQHSRLSFVIVGVGHCERGRCLARHLQLCVKGAAYPYLAPGARARLPRAPATARSPESAHSMCFPLSRPRREPPPSTNKAEPRTRCAERNADRAGRAGGRCTTSSAAACEPVAERAALQGRDTLRWLPTPGSRSAAAGCVVHQVMTTFRK